MRKSHFKISSLPPGICITEKKKSLSYLLIVFPFPFGGTYCNEKRNEGRLFLTEGFVNTVDFTGRADIRSSWRGETENESDQSETKWSVTRVCCNEEPWLWTTLHSLLFISKWRQAHRGWLPSTEPGPSWTSVLDCTEKWSMMASPVRHI